MNCYRARVPFHRVQQGMPSQHPSGSVLGCCGRFWPLNAVPFQCPCCRQLYLKEPMP